MGVIMLSDRGGWQIKEAAEAAKAAKAAKTKRQKPPRKVVRRRDPVGGVAPPTNEVAANGDAVSIKTEDDDVVALGREAWLRLKLNPRKTLEDWKQAGSALLVGHELAKRHAGKANGQKYSSFFHPWLKTNGFSDMDKDDRAKLIWVMNYLEEVEAWLETRSESERARWAHPYTIWVKARCRQRGLAQYRENETGKPSSNGSSAARAGGDQDDELGETEWQRKLGERAMAAIRGAPFPYLLALDEPPEPGLIEVCVRAVGEWQRSVDLLQEIADASPEEIDEKRQAETERLAKLDEYKARKLAEAVEKGERLPPDS